MSARDKICNVLYKSESVYLQMQNNLEKFQASIKYRGGIWLKLAQAYILNSLAQLPLQFTIHLWIQ